MSKREALERWRDNPLAFVTEAMQIEPHPWQARVLQDIADGHKRFAIRSGHGVGKTALECWVILWFMLFRRPCKIPVTANSQDQLRDVVFAELRLWRDRLPDELQDMIEVHVERAFIKGDSENSFAVARTAREEKPEALQGFHSPHTLFIIEEASGIGDKVFEVAGGALTAEGAIEIMAGNPTRTSGRFYRAFHGNRDEFRTHHVDCLNPAHVNPVLTAEDHRAYARQVASEYNEDSNVYRVRVRGEFPTSEDSAVIPLGLVEAAINREIRVSEDYVPVWGVDVARFGDDACAVAKRAGPVLLEPVVEWRKADLMETTGRIVQMYRETPDREKPGRINVDVIGLGSGVCDRLRELGLPVYDVNVGEASSRDKQRFMRLRDELWWSGRDWFDDKACTMPHDDGLVSELVVPLYKFESTGKIKVESKQELKDRGVKSPNKADAFLLTFAGGDELRGSNKRNTIATGTVDYDPFEFANSPSWRSEYEKTNGNMQAYDPFENA